MVFECSVVGSTMFNFLTYSKCNKWATGVAVGIKGFKMNAVIHVVDLHCGNLTKLI